LFCFSTRFYVEITGLITGQQDAFFDEQIDAASQGALMMRLKKGKIDTVTG